MTWSPISFVRSAHDVRRLGTVAAPEGPLVVAKIETASAIDNLAGILDAAGAIMIARGDLGIECPLEDLPHLQKRIIRECIAQGRPAITATQMLESMTTAATPTRAEASDVANAVFDGSSAVMLSGETATGRDPVNVVATMARLCARADANFDTEGWTRLVGRLRVNDPARPDGPYRHVTDTMTDAAWRVAQELDATAILCLTRSGVTVRAIARYRPRAPILGFAPDERVRNQLSVSWGATPLPLTRLRRQRGDGARGAPHRSRTGPRGAGRHRGGAVGNRRTLTGHRRPAGDPDHLTGTYAAASTAVTSGSRRPGARRRPPRAIASAAPTRIAESAKVRCMPAATAGGGALDRRAVPAPRVKTAPITEAPVISPRLRDRFSSPEVTPRCSAGAPDITAVLLAVWKSA